MDLQKVLELDKTERFDGEFEGHKFWFEAKSHKVTPAFHDALVKAANEPLVWTSQMAGILTDWSIVLGGEAFPPTAENLAKIPEDFIWELFNIMAASWSGDAKKQKASASA